MQGHDDTAPSLVKVAIAWLGAFVGTITLQDVVLTLTAIYTILQVYVLVRDKIVRGGK